MLGKGGLYVMFCWLWITGMDTVEGTVVQGSVFNCGQ